MSELPDRRLESWKQTPAPVSHDGASGNAKPLGCADLGKSTKCLAKFCRKMANKKRYHSPYCSKHRSSRFRAAHPMMAHYLDLKNRARQRGHEFTLTIEDYRHFWITSGYAEKHGKTKESLSINRIENSLGYVAGNVNAVTLSENSTLMRNPYRGLTGDEIAYFKKHKVKP